MNDETFHVQGRYYPQCYNLAGTMEGCYELAGWHCSLEVNIYKRLPDGCADLSLPQTNQESKEAGQCLQCSALLCCFTSTFPHSEETFSAVMRSQHPFQLHCGHGKLLNKCIFIFRLAIFTCIYHNSSCNHSHEVWFQQLSATTASHLLASYLKSKTLSAHRPQHFRKRLVICRLTFYIHGCYTLASSTYGV